MKEITEGCLQIAKPFPDVAMFVNRPILTAIVTTPRPRMTARPIFSLRLGSFRSRTRGKGNTTSIL